MSYLSTQSDTRMVATTDVAAAGVAIFSVLEKAIQQSSEELEVQWKQLVIVLHTLDHKAITDTNMMDTIITGLQFQDRHAQLLDDVRRVMQLYRRLLTQPMEDAGTPVEQLFSCLKLTDLRTKLQLALEGTERYAAFAEVEPDVELF